MLTDATASVADSSEPQPRPRSLADARAQRAARQTHTEATEVQRLPFDLSALEDDGIFLNVDAQGFGLLDRQLTWQSLGVALPKSANVAFRSPRCGLLPDRYRLPLLRPAARAHDALNRLSYRFTLTETLFETPAYRYVPWRAFPEFEREFQAAQVALDRAKSAVLTDYDFVREEVVATFLALANDSVRRLRATGHPTSQGFEDTIVAGFLRAFPTPEDLRTKLVLRYRVCVVLLGSEMLAEQRKAREERRRLQDAEAAIELGRQRHRAQARLVQTELWADEERIRCKLAAEAEEQQREAEVKERLRRMKLETAKEQMRAALSPLEEGARQLHSAVYEAAHAIRESLRKHQYLPGSSAKRARDLARWFRLMNWQSDEQLEALVAELESLAAMPTGKRKRDPRQIEAVLGDIIELCYADARELAQPHRMTALEI